MTKNNKPKESAYAALTGPHRAVPIVLIALAVFITVCFFTQNTGSFGRAISGFFRGLFAFGAYFVPVLLAIHAFFYPSDRQKKRIIKRIIFSVVLLIFISAFAHAISFWGEDASFVGRDAYANGKAGIGGGFIGGAFAFLLISCVGYFGLVLVAVTVLAVYITYFLAGEDNPAKELLRKAIYGILSFFAKIESRMKSRKERRKEKAVEEEIERTISGTSSKKDAKRLSAIKQKEGELLDDEFFEVDNGFKEFKIRDFGIEEVRDDETIELNPTLQEKVHHPMEVEEVYTPIKPSHGITTDYGLEEKEDTTYAKAPDTEKIYEAPRTAFAYGLDDNADNVFTDGFVAFDVAESEKIAARVSTVGPAIRKEEREATDAERAFTEKDIEAARRRADFELRREQLRKQRELEEEERRRAAEFVPTTVEFDINPEKAPKEEPEAPVYEAPKVYEEPAAPAYEAPKVYEEPAAPTYEAPKVYDEPAAPAYEAPKVYEEPAAPTYEAPKVYDEPAAPAYEAPKVYEESAAPAYEAPKVYEEPAAPAYEAPKSTFVFDDEDEFDEEDEGEMFSGDENTPVSETLTTFDFEEEDGDEDMPEIPLEKQNPVINDYRNMFTALSGKQAEEDSPSIAEQYAAAMEYEEEISTAVPTEDSHLYSYGDDLNDDSEDTPIYTPDAIDEDEEDDEDEPPFEIERAPKREEKKAEEKAPAPKPDYSAFSFPPIDLLKKGVEEEDPTIEEEIAENGDKLIDALAQFDVRASIKSVDRGPRITRYEIVPARGVRVSKVIGLFDDIALAVAAEGIRMEAPIPGKSAIGVEIPNRHPSTVYLRDLLESYEFQNEPSKTFACFGKDVTGNPVFGDIAKMPHMLIAGATGMGKSVAINSILISILYRARPDEVKFIMIDPKTVEFKMYSGIPHLLVPVVTEARQAAGALMWAVDEMNRRYELLSKYDVRKLDSYNELVAENPELGEPLPQIIIVIDELNDLMLQVRKPVEGLIMSITQKARAAGIHMIIGTQRPSVDVITGVIKANIPSRVSCKVTSVTDSRTILDQVGAEKLLDKGDMLFFPVGKPKPLRVQGAFVSDSEVDKIMKHLKSNVRGAVYDEQALEDMNRAAAKCTKGGKEDVDDDGDTHSSEEGAGFLKDKQFLEAVDLAIKSGKVSTSLIQRRISVGYSKAAKFIDIMEELGIVSEPNGQKPREVLVTKQEWAEMIARRDVDD
ncbi:MAG: hypothetical protein IJD51_03280 [Clostridia bacterium]|nr:hypothetical protein [Clostridia bacterium]